MKIGQSLALVGAVLVVGAGAYYVLVIAQPASTRTPATTPRPELPALAESTAPPPPTAPQPLTVSIDLPATFHGQTIQAMTNLPNGTQMMASLQLVGDCAPECGFVWQSGFRVENGGFTLGPFNVQPGPYTLEITTPTADHEPTAVRSVIGQHGENLRGQYVRAELEPGAGQTVRYTAKVTVPTPDSADTQTPSATPSPEATADPYANDYRAQQLADYRQKKAVFLDRVRYLYFSVGCKVFGSEAAIMPLYNEAAEGLTASTTVIDTSSMTDVRNAAHDGLTRAAKPGECSYWHAHPDEVFELRREAEAAMEAISP